MKTYAVLTGDIIGSSKLGPDGVDAAMSLLRRLAKEFEETHPGAVVGQPEVFRGDSWQLGLQRPALALTAAVFIRAGFKAGDFDTRIGIGWGAVDRLNTERISQSVGPAFVRSGEALDRLGKDRTLALPRFGGPAPGGSADSAFGILEVGVGLLDALVARWTQRESVAIYGTLRGLSQEAIAELPQAQTKEGNAPTRQAVQDALSRVSWTSHVLPFLDRAEKTIEEVLQS
jgi:hypothetical protein